MQIKSITKNKGFTLIEMMVSVSIFAIVVMISMGAIFTVVDSNKKAQSLKSVMNNLNFALEAMTRTIKTGQIKPMTDDTFIEINDQSGNLVKFSLSSTSIERDCTQQSPSIACDSSGLITSPEVEIKNLKFIDIKTVGRIQPGVVILVSGRAKLSERVWSDFSIQSTITQRLPEN